MSTTLDSLETVLRPRQLIRPHHSVCGTMRQQLDAIDIYLDDPTRHRDPAGAWQMARRLVMQHARRLDR